MTTPANASDNFVKEVRRTIEYHRQEWDLTYSEAVGCLVLVQYDLCKEASSEVGDTE